MSDPAAASADEVTRAVGPEIGRQSHWRVLVMISLVLAGLLTAPAVTAHWAQRTLNDTERYVQTVRPLVDSPEVQDAVVAKVTNALEQRVDVEAILNDVFSGIITERPRLQQLTGLLAGAVNAQIERVTREFVESPTFADLWVRANTRAQQTLQLVLRGNGSGAVSLQDGEIVLALDEVIEQVSQRLVDRGIPVVSHLPVPQTDRQIVLLKAPALQDLRTIYRFANPVAVWLLPAVGLLYLAAFALSRRRARTTVAIGVLVAASALLLALGLRVGRQIFVNQLADTDFGEAGRVFYDTLLVELVRGQQLLTVLGLLLITLGWFAGTSRSGSAVRGALTPLFVGTAREHSRGGRDSGREATGHGS